MSKNPPDGGAEPGTPVDIDQAVQDLTAVIAALTDMTIKLAALVVAVKSLQAARSKHAKRRNARPASQSRGPRADT